MTEEKTTLKAFNHMLYTFDPVVVTKVFHKALEINTKIVASDNRTGNDQYLGLYYRPFENRLYMVPVNPLKPFWQYPSLCMFVSSPRIFLLYLAPEEKQNELRFSIKDDDFT